MKTGFIQSFHGLRGIASLMVFYAHITWGYINHVNPVYSDRVQELITNFGTFGVEIFFFLSGFVIFVASQKSDVQRFFKSRFWRIYPVFILFTLLYFFANHFTGIEPEKDKLVYLLSNMLFLDLFFKTPPLTPNAWSITYEIWYYVITFFLVKAVYSRKLEVMSFVSAGLLIYFVLYHPITIYFIFGVLLAIVSKRNYFNLPVWLVSVIQIAALLMTVYLSAKGVKFASDGWGSTLVDFQEWLLPCALFVLMASLISAKSILSRMLVFQPILFLGNISYSLYLLHPYSYRVSRVISNKFGFGNETIDFAFYIILTTALSVFLAYLLNRFFENKIYNYFTKRNIYNS